MKLYVGHMRMEDQMSKMIRIIQENEGLQYGYNAQIMEVEGQYKLSDMTWIDEIAKVMRTREITIVNSYKQEGVNTSNKSIMD